MSLGRDETGGTFHGEAEPSPAEHAATVRSVLPAKGSLQHTVVALLAEWHDAHDALAALVAQAERADGLERELPLRLARIYEIDGMQDLFARVASGYEEYDRKLEAAEARADQLQRDLARCDETAGDEHARRVEAEARAGRAEAALRQIANAHLHNIPGVNPDGSVSSDTMAVCIARAALAGETSP